MDESLEALARQWLAGDKSVESKLIEWLDGGGHIKRSLALEVDGHKLLWVGFNHLSEGTIYVDHY